MLTRATVVWFGLLALAIANGAVREAFLAEPFGDTVAHALSSLMLSGAILLLAWVTIPWVDPASTADAWQAGALWLVLTLAFEFLAGHFLFGTSWRRLLSDYDVIRGRIWIVVLMTTLLAPVVAGRLHRLWPTQIG